MKLSFIQLSGFGAAWGRMGLTDEDLQELEAAIQAAPLSAPVMRGTGRLRKVRFSPGRSSRGKSGGMRACYAYFGEFGLVYLCAVYPKNEKANLTAAECAAYKSVLDRFDQYLRQHWKKGFTP